MRRFDAAKALEKNVICVVAASQLRATTAGICATQIGDGMGCSDCARELICEWPITCMVDNSIQQCTLFLCGQGPGVIGCCKEVQYPR